MLIIVCGSIGRSVTGGQAWANLQYLLGLRALGHDVYYLEDAGDWSVVYDWRKGEETWDLDLPANFLRRCLEPSGFAQRWCYRAGEAAEGLSVSKLRELCAAADLLLIRGIPLLVWRPEYDLPARRAFIDIDPGFTQIRFVKGEPAFVETIERSEVLFTFGQNIGARDCPIPTGARSWWQTLPPIALEQWQPITNYSAPFFTSVVRWRGVKDVEFGGTIYGQRDKEFQRFLNLPRMTKQPLQLALTGGGEAQCRSHGWDVLPGWQVSESAAAYQSYIQQSRAELGIAKHCYVETRSGWFSDRTVCYLASGRPALVQDTGLDWLATGKGVLTFRTPDEAAGQIEAINSDYQLHCQAARTTAEKWFGSSGVLAPLLEIAMEGTPFTSSTAPSRQ